VVARASPSVEPYILALGLLGMALILRRKA